MKWDAIHIWNWQLWDIDLANRQLANFEHLLKFKGSLKELKDIKYVRWFFVIRSLDWCNYFEGEPGCTSELSEIGMKVMLQAFDSNWHLFVSWIKHENVKQTTYFYALFSHNYQTSEKNAIILKYLFSVIDSNHDSFGNFSLTTNSCNNCSDAFKAFWSLLPIFKFVLLYLVKIPDAISTNFD